DHAIQIGRKYRHSVYMVTLAGESFAPGGSITGGAFKNNDNLLGRKREIEELTVSSAALRKEADRLHTEIETLREERNSWRTKLAAEHEARQKMLLRLNTVELTRKQAEEQLQDSRINLRSLQNELQEIERQIQDVNSQNSGVARTLAESEDLEASVSNRADELRAKETELRTARENQAAALQKLRVEAAAAGEQKVFREETKIRLERELASLETEKRMLAASISSGGDDILAKQKQIEEVQKTIDSGEEEASALEKEREELMTKKRALSESHREFFEKRDELSDRMGRLDREHFRLTSQKEKFETGREERAAYMWEEYDMTPGDVRAYVLPEKSEDRAALRKELARIKDTIRKLGHVNVNAIEEYKVVAERHTFLTAQHDDLIKSEETLAGIIANLDEGMRRQFKEKFAEIQVEFDKAFKELFGGGHGSIELDPDADLLEAGIAIIAHPPGKKLQNMMQLSGGEKALTAIALLFAIQNLKPSPFCLLDEIEAALDENNVDRFAQYLHKLTKNTQFIIITHRRGTMTTADRLYGITMQEKGVSTLVSVNLIEDELTK
ncbi:MAG: AAA family ATPase, partial [Lachnospiraceae bacterium]|nr:AAA family ATPase [Lachnospiraceae bacterium]